VYASIDDGHTLQVPDANYDAKQQDQLDFVKPTNWIEDDSDSEEELKHEHEKPSKWVGEEKECEVDHGDEFMKPSNWVDDGQINAAIDDGPGNSAINHKFMLIKSKSLPQIPQKTSLLVDLA
jgi:hypothetical protein